MEGGGGEGCCKILLPPPLLQVLTKPGYKFTGWLSLGRLFQGFIGIYKLYYTQTRVLLFLIIYTFASPFTFKDLQPPPPQTSLYSIIRANTTTPLPSIIFKKILSSCYGLFYTFFVAKDLSFCHKFKFLNLHIFATLMSQPFKISNY